MQHYLERLKAWLLTNSSLKRLGAEATHPSLWKWGGEPCARAVAVGLFVCWIPAPGQMLIAATAALKFRANLPISTSLVWVSNPLTWAPIYYFAYWAGCKIMAIMPITISHLFNPESNPLEFEFAQMGATVVLPLTIGTFLSATLFSIIGYLATLGMLKLYEKIKP